jgi:hypothetical protein
MLDSRIMDTQIQLSDGETLLAIVQDSKVLAHTWDIALSHAEFVRRAIGTLPAGAWVGTLRKADGQVTPFNSRTFYGNQLPAAPDVVSAVTAMFR